MIVESIFLDEFEYVYAIVGETSGPYGENSWVVKMFRHKEEALCCIDNMINSLGELGISDDIYAHTVGRLPSDFIDQDAIRYHDNCGIRYFIHAYDLS